MFRARLIPIHGTLSLINQMKSQSNQTEYRGGDHKYKAPLTDIAELYNSPNSQSMHYPKDKLVEWAVKSLFDENLTNTQRSRLV